MENAAFSSISIDTLIQQLGTSAVGLSDAKALEKLKLHSEIHRKGYRLGKRMQLLFRQFRNPLLLLLLIAAILSAILGESSDSIIILTILITTAIFGFIQEMQAGRAMEKLRSLIEVKHCILREGREITVSSSEIVPGDIVVLNAGSIIPADCRIIDSDELHMNESTITGESFPVEKMSGQTDSSLPLHELYNCLWQGTSVISGTAKALVVNTGQQTLFGKMAHSLEQTQETAFEKGIKKFGYFILRITILLAIFILVANLYFNRPLFESVLFSLALAVGMAPELLPAIMTFSMASGGRRMMKKKVIVKKLSSIFNLGATTMLCTDKTGTITEGEVKVKSIVDSYGQSSEKLRLYAYLNARLQKGFTNPIDLALMDMNIPCLGFEKINEVPYDFIRKRLSVAVRFAEEEFFITKGAFEQVLEICSYQENASGEKTVLSKLQREQIQQTFKEYSEQGFRVLGLAYKVISVQQISRNNETEMVFLGFILLEDPLKETTISSIHQLKELEIETKIITGDNRFSAMHAAAIIGVSDPQLLTGGEIAKMSPDALVIKAKHADIFAEIEPQQKEMIIKALKKSRFVVAYLGDGINDVAAINAADVGISTSNAVGVAKEAADFVLLEKDLAVLADGVREGRKSFANSMKYVFINTGATFGNMLSVAGASLFLPFIPMLPKQILLTNLITDIPFLSIASDRVDQEQVSKPGGWNLRMIRQFMIVFGLHSTFFDLMTFAALYSFLQLSGTAFQTGWFLESAITELLILFIIRTRVSVFRSRPGRLLLILSIIAFLVTVLLPFSPFAAALGFNISQAAELITIAVILLAYFITADWLKVIFFRKFGKETRKHTT